MQHQFEGAFWARNGDWKRDHAALAGSSHYDLPPVLRWFTANIGIHHVHHLSSRIPFYRLPKVLKDHPELRPVSRVGLWESFRCARLALWDEAAGRLVSFREARARGLTCSQNRRLRRPAHPRRASFAYGAQRAVRRCGMTRGGGMP